jgi:hypothetical protein
MHLGAIEFHKVAHKHRVKDYIKIAKRIELQEEKLMNLLKALKGFLWNTN